MPIRIAYLIQFESESHFLGGGFMWWAEWWEALKQFISLYIYIKA